MLRELSIENFAIIDRLTACFEPGMTAITGETGAGKSIVIDALQAALGARTSVDVVRSGSRTAVVEAIFDVGCTDGDGPLAPFLAELDVDPEDSLILRREISGSGRGVARVNGRALPVSTLQSLGNLLVDIHGQSDHLSILRHDRQLEVLDSFGDLRTLKDRVASSIGEWRRARRELEELIAGRRRLEQQLDLLRFQVDEIESAQLVPDEERELEASRARFANAEKLAQLSAAAYDVLYGDAGGAIEKVEAARSATREVAVIDASLETVNQRLEAARYELVDIAEELRRYRDQVEDDPKRLRETEDRLDLLARLRRKYGATIAEVISFGDRARSSLWDVENVDDRIANLEARVEQAARDAGDLAGELSVARSRVATELESAIAVALDGLGLGATCFAAELTRTEANDGLDVPALGNRYATSSSGIDEVSFQVSFNPGEPLRPIDKVASGGETSRFLLALKSVLASADQVHTLVFDEVDVGVGARHGSVVGHRLRDLARTHQVLCISHLPQVAALADHHLAVRKLTAGERTTITIQYLDEDERVSEIAAMMTGSVTETARQNARELLAAAQRS